MSTLDGLLVGISTITANDLVLNLLSRGRGRPRSEREKMRLALRAGHIALIAIAVLVFFLTLNPPKLLGIFGQLGVYGLVLAAVPPLVAGVWFEQARLRLVWAASVLALILHFGLYFFGTELFPNSDLAFANPGLTATIGLLGSLVPTLILHSVLPNEARSAPHTEQV
jgi:Na+/pantothenate symporter